MRSIGWSLATLLLTVFVAADSYAQKGGRDYYAPRVTTEDRQFLDNVEKPHLAPSQQKRGNKDFASAKGDLEFVLRYYPNHPLALDLISQLCTTYSTLPNCDADLWFEAALALNPQAAPTYVVYGIHLQRKGKTAEAVTQYRNALRLDPNSINAHYNIALALFDLKQFEESNAHAQAAYAGGVPYAGLRDKLTRAGQWKPLDDRQTAPIIKQGNGVESTPVTPPK
jgi:tetratricopeptide (TPR) repeat protein